MRDVQLSYDALELTSTVLLRLVDWIWNAVHARYVVTYERMIRLRGWSSSNQLSFSLHGPKVGNTSSGPASRTLVADFPVYSRAKCPKVGLVAWPFRVVEVDKEGAQSPCMQAVTIPGRGSSMPFVKPGRESTRP